MNINPQDLELLSQLKRRLMKRLLIFTLILLIVIVASAIFTPASGFIPASWISHFQMIGILLLLILLPRSFRLFGKEMDFLLPQLELNDGIKFYTDRWNRRLYVLVVILLINALIYLDSGANISLFASVASLIGLYFCIPNINALISQFGLDLSAQEQEEPNDLNV